MHVEKMVKYLNDYEHPQPRKQITDYLNVSKNYFYYQIIRKHKDLFDRPIRGHYTLSKKGKNTIANIKVKTDQEISKLFFSVTKVRKFIY